MSFLVKPKNKKKQLKKKELIETLQRTAADFENYKKRIEKEKENIAIHQTASTIQAFLPLLDTIEEAEKSIQKNTAELKGITLIKKQLYSILENLGVKEINCLGKEYNSTLHECLLTEQNKKKKDGEITQVLQKGFTFNEKILRPARVKVNKL